MSNQHASDSLNPADFVQRIRQLGEKRDLAEEAERSRALEEEILQGRSERLARRAEHVRSLSKSSEPLTPQSPKSFFEPLKEVSEKQSPVTEMDTNILHSMNRLTGNSALDEENLSPEPTFPKPTETSTPPIATSPTTPSGTALTRGLSWQQRRPNSSSGGRRPLSVMAAENSASRSPPKASPGPASPEEQDLSRARIIQSLGAKDSSWFRQTSERGTNSPANRRSRGEVSPSGVDSISGRRQLPGIARDSVSAEKRMEGNSPAEGGHSRSPSRSSSVRGSARWSNQLSTASTSLSGFSRQTEQRSPTHSLDTFKIPPPPSENTSSLLDEDDSFSSGKSLAMSPSQERISAVQVERSTSPTKGMGGFVQSAMLKRNESVSKRWSAQTHTGLSRQNSFIGNSNTAKSNEGSPIVSRSNSIEQNSAALDRKDSLSRLSSMKNDFPKLADPRDDVFVKPSIPSHSRSKSVLSNASSAPAVDRDEAGSTSRPSSPSKRWSPVKASWLENALKRPAEPLKPMASLPSQQPSWMAEISKTKSQRSSVDVGNATKHQKGGSSDLKLPQLKSTSASAAKVAEKEKGEVKKMNDSTSVYESTKKDVPKEEEEEVDTKVFERNGSKTELSADHENKSPSFPENHKSPVSHEPPESETSARKPSTTTSTTGSTLSTTLHLNRTVVPSSTLRSDIAPPLPKTTENETAAKTDFRSVLKPRQLPATSSQPENKEFLSAIGNLKRTQTKNYVAPDELKNNILRGKAALNVTGGPKKSERIDEFKESILKQKEAMKVKAEAEKLAEGSGSPKEGPKATKKEEEVPEAAAMRNALGKGIKTVGAGAGAGTGAGASRVMGANGSRLGSGKGESSEKPERIEISNAAAKKSHDPSEADKKSEPLQLKPTVRESAAPSNLLSPKRTAQEVDKEPLDITEKPSDFKLPNSSASLAAAAAIGRKIDNKPALNGSRIFEKDQKPSITGAVDIKGGTSKQVGPLLKESSRDKLEASKSSLLKEEPSKTSASKSDTTSSPGLRGLKSPPLSRKFIEDKLPSPGKAVASPSPPASSSKLANRLNPALASLIAKGAAQKNASDSDSPQKMAVANPTGAAEDLKGSEPKGLTHMTRGRAKGPKRKPPSIKAQIAHDLELESEKLSSDPLIAEFEENKHLPNDSTSTSPKDEGTANNSSLLQSEASTTPQSSLNDFQSPRNTKLNADESNDHTYRNYSPTTSRNDSSTTQPQQDFPTRKSVTLSQTPHIPPFNETDTRRASRSPSPRSRVFQFHSPTSPLATQQYISSTEGLGISSMPSPTSKDPIRQASKGPRSREGTDSITSIKDLDAHVRNGPTKASDSPSRPTVVMTQHTRSCSTSPTKLQELSSPVKKVDNHNFPYSGPGSPRSGGLVGDQTSNNSIFADYFDVTPVTPAHLLDHIDTQAMLNSTNSGSLTKIRTIRKQIFEVRDDEKMETLPAQQEHMLYEQEMYVCVHVFASVEGTKSTEVFLWSGSGVSENALEDAQPVAKKVAKENGTKLLTSIRQGKETPNFFQALGGILITLRGTRAESRSKYMLCGRKHLGHVTFDEVDFALGSFCSGFPFLISRGAGKLLLWKGLGCSVEELGCARLISMDLGGGAIGDELSEIEEGHEPQWFFDMFASDTMIAPATTATARKMPRSAEYWKAKAKSPRYHVRLFRVKQQQHTSSQKLSTDSQSRFQLGSSWPFRRPSWNSATSSSPPPTPPSKVGTPPVTGSPGLRLTSSSSPSQQIKASIVEIEPFNQSDLEPENVYVLDAFFEIYIIVGPLSRTQSTAFATALLFAQDYGILAASLQDRPFVPVSTVVLEGAPRDMKAAFRQWEDRFLPTGALMAGKPKRGKSLRLVGLAAAIAATREG